MQDRDVMKVRLVFVKSRRRGIFRRPTRETVPGPFVPAKIEVSADGFVITNGRALTQEVPAGFVEAYVEVVTDGLEPIATGAVEISTKPHPGDLLQAEFSVDLSSCWRASPTFPELLEDAGWEELTLRRRLSLAVRSIPALVADLFTRGAA
jgi:hypothetical protein